MGSSNSKQAAEHQRQLREIKETHEADIRRLLTQEKQDFEALLSQHKVEIGALEGLQSSISKQTEIHRQQDEQLSVIQQLRDTLESQALLKEKYHKEALEEQVRAHQHELGLLREEHDRSFEQFKAHTAKRMEELEKMAKNRDEETRRKDAQILSLERELEQSEAQATKLRNELSDISLGKSQADATIGELKREHESKTARMKSEFEERERNLRSLAKKEEDAHAVTQTQKAALEKQISETSDLMSMFKTMVAEGSAVPSPPPLESKDQEADDTEVDDADDTLLEEGLQFEHSSEQVAAARLLRERVEPCILGKRMNWDLARRHMNDWTGVELEEFANEPTTLKDGEQDEVANNAATLLPTPRGRKFGGLVGLVLSNCNLTCDLAELGPLLGPHLRKLKLDKNQNLKGNIAHLLGGSLDKSQTWMAEQQLRTLDLHYTQVTGSLAIFKNCPHLTTVALGYTKVYGDIGIFSNCPRLQELRLYMCKGVTGDISSMQGCKQMQWLDLTGTTVTGSVQVFKHCPHLQWLWLDDTKVAGDLAMFAATPKLVELWLNGTQVRGDRALFGRVLPNCSLVLDERK